MAFYLKDLAENPQLLRDLRARADAHRCVECDTPLQETLTGKRQIAGKDACSDCFYDELGKLVEEHPIASAGKRRS
jgi:hypothetical protein